VFDYSDSTTLFLDDQALGKVAAVDTGTVTVRVNDPERLQRLQVNRLVVLQTRPGQHLIGLIQKISRQVGDDPVTENLPASVEPGQHPVENNTVRIVLIGTLFHRIGGRRQVFRRSIECVPQIDSLCFALEGERLTDFMGIITHDRADPEPALSLGTYTLDHGAAAYLSGDKFFQRHAVIVGSTGSGKSWTTARLLEQVADLPNANVLVHSV
jgi:uncharacterized protein